MTTDLEFDPFAGPAIQRTAASTDPQRELWTAVQMGEDASCAFNESISLDLEGALDLAALEGALSDLVARHEVLRSSFSADGTQLLVAEPSPVPLALVDLSGKSEAEQRDALDRHLAREVETPFALEQGPLLRAALLRFSPTRHRFTFTAHHIVCDGFSMAVILRELAALYTARRTGIPAALAQAPLFTRYAESQRVQVGTEAWTAAERYWLSQFKTAPAPVDLPADRPRPAVRTWSSRREDVVLAADLVEAVKRAGAQAGCSFFTTLLAGFEALVYRLTGQDDLVVGIPAAGQSFVGESGLVGHCVNTLALRTAVRGGAPFTELARSVRTTMLDGYEHQVLTFGALLEKLPLARDPSRLPLTSLLFNVDQAVRGEDLPFDGLKVRFSSNPRHFENFDLFINAAESNGQVVLECQYNTELYDGASVRRWMASYQELLRAVAANPATSIDELPIVSADELERMHRWNAERARPFERGVTLHQLVSRAATAHPSSVAVEAADGRLTYAELEARSNRLARKLRAIGVRRGAGVGLCTDRSLDLVVGLFGILKAGGAYVPLDPAFPKERLAFYAEDSGLAALVSQASLEGTVAAEGVPTVLLDRDRAELEALDASPLPAGADDAGPEDVAYVIYTSGSTGKPKGVLVPHRSVVNFLLGVGEEPGIRTSDALLAVTTLSFDIAVLELYLPLLHGARVVLASKEMAQDGALLAQAIRERGVTVMQATPATWRLLLAAGFEGGEGFTALVGGEALPKDLAAALAGRVGVLQNMYGPTETTVWSTSYRVPRSGAPVLIGKPLANQTVYVLDARLRPVPLGVPGELYIGGEGVTLGYLGRPELTAERFLADPFRPGGDMYRTGDVVRLLEGGDLEYFGRNDFQVKVRGYRIELGEIEAALSSHPGVAQAVALVREDRPGDVRLVGYVVPRAGEVAEDALRSHLRSTLPEYMVPQHFIHLPRLPLTPNNKVDRKALPAPTAGAQSTAVHVEPRTDAERLVASVWQEVLGLPRLSVTDDFFKLGGHSLLAAQAMSRLQRDHGIVIGMRKLFEAPTVEQFARLLPSEGTQQPGAAPAIPRLADGVEAPLSLMQQRVWFLEQFEPGLAVWHLPSAFRIHGALDESAFERAFNAVLERQEALRTHVGRVGDDAVQVVTPHVFRPLPALDLRGLADSGQVLMDRMQADADQVFDLERGPLYRVALYRLKDAEYVFFFVVHHIVWDGWSFDTFLSELHRLYGAFARGQPAPLEPLPIRYRDFAAWNRTLLEGDALNPHRSFWHEQLKAPLPVLELPTDRPRPANMSHRGTTLTFEIHREDVDRLTATARERNATLYMALLAGFKALLHRYTGQEDLALGTPVRGRTMPETEDLLGFFVNTVVLRTQVSADLPFVTLLERVRTTALDAFSHQEMPFELLVRELNVPRDPSRTPIYQVLFGYQDTRNREYAFGDLPYSQVNLAVHAAPTDIYLWVKETGKALVCGIEYAEDLFDASTIERMVESYCTLLRDAARHPEARVGDLALVPHAQLAQMEAWNRSTTRAFERGVRVDQLVSRAAAAHASSVAVDAADGKLTYAELETRSNQLARHLRRLGVKRGSLVGLCTERSPEMAVGLIGILKAGGAYVPLDASFPKERLAFYVEDSRMQVLLTQSSVRGVLPESSAQTVLLDQERAAIDALDGTSLPAGPDDAGPEDVAYVIYTSGSTGKPKGVLVPHRSVVNFLFGVTEEVGPKASDALLAVTTLSFDIAVLELCLPLMHGARVVLATKEMAQDGTQLVRAIRERGIAVMQATPATWRLLLAAGFEGGEGFTALVGGEALPKDLAAALVSRVGVLQNLYGPTETTVWSTSYRVPRTGEPVLIGKPLANQTVYVLDAELRPVPLGVPGELYIGGEGVTLGYHNRPELTAERFVKDSFRAGGTMYRTGDVVRLLESGDLEYFGRNDGQVKLRGYRIELGEIEAALSAHEAVAQSAALVREDHPGDVRLVGYIVVRAGADYTDTELRKHLRRTLPDYMVPQHFVALEAMPLTPNGKLDRKALPAPLGIRATVESEYVAPRTSSEQLLAAVWQEVLRLDRIGLHDNFFHLGGHSLQCLQVVARVETKTGVRLNPRVMVLNSLQQVAAMLPDGSEAAVVAKAVEQLTAPTPQVPLTQSTSFARRVLDKLRGRD